MTYEDENGIDEERIIPHYCDMDCPLWCTRKTTTLAELRQRVIDQQAKAVRPEKGSDDG